MSNLESAISIAVEKHAGQVDKAGWPYILHPLRVMFQMDTAAEMITAVLHDVVEDTPVTPNDLEQKGFNNEVIAAIDSVTNRPGETYDDFIERAASNPIGRKVKMADLRDNLDISRIAEPTQKDYERLKKYKRALRRLEALEDPRRSAPNELSSILIHEKETEQGLTRLSAEISDDADLIIKDYFIGKMAQEVYSHDDSESCVTLKKEFKDTLLLRLLKGRFKQSSELREWLDSNSVPYELEIWP